MTLKIEKIDHKRRTTVRLIGRVRAEDLPEVTKQLEASGPGAVLQLDEVTLVDVDVVRFLSLCESEGIQFLHCSAYVRESIAREQETANKKIN